MKRIKKKHSAAEVAGYELCLRLAAYCKHNTIDRPWIRPMSGMRRAVKFDYLKLPKREQTLADAAMEGALNYALTLEMAKYEFTILRAKEFPPKVCYPK